MLITLIRRELLAHLLAYRFFVAMVVLLVLVIANTVVLIYDYERRLTLYSHAVQRHNDWVLTTKTYSPLYLQVDRPPNPLSLFNQGLEKRLGNTVRVHHAFVPTLWDAALHGMDNPFLNLLSSIDLVVVFQVVLSLLALLFAYDAIAGEHEKGSLRLLMTTPASRGKILVAKYIAAMIALVVPLTISLILTQFLISGSWSIVLSVDDWIRIGGFYLTSILFLSVFYLMGLLFSTTTRRTVTALMSCMFAWVFFVLIYPNLILFVSNPKIDPQEEGRAVFQELAQIWKRFDSERLQLLKDDSLEGEDPFLNVGYRGETSGPDFHYDTMTLEYYHEQTMSFDDLSEESEAAVPHAKAFFRQIEPLRIKTAERAWIMRQQALSRIFIRSVQRDRFLTRVSPASVYDLGTEAWLGTNLYGLQHFFEAVRQYRQTLIAYFYDKNAFGSRQWFASDEGAVDWSDLPRFTYQRPDVRVAAAQALPDLMLLLLINAMLFMGSYLIFVRQEI